MRYKGNIPNYVTETDWERIKETVFPAMQLVLVSKKDREIVVDIPPIFNDAQNKSFMSAGGWIENIELVTDEN